LLFSSWIFWVFLPVVLAGYFLLRHAKQNALLLVASLVFYGWWDWRFVGLLAFTATLDFCVALGLDRRAQGTDDHLLPRSRRKALLLASVVANLGVLAFFKYFHFFEDSLVDLMSSVAGHRVEPTGLDIILPAGISFYTFQSMSYTIDVYRGELRATRSLVDFGAFVTFFPHLVAGPIVRASILLPQVAKPRHHDSARFNEGGYLILWGMFKKVVVADNVSPLVGAIFAANPASLSGGTVLLASYAFALQIYCDFSGYTDIARGCAKLMGFEIPLNFNLPYAARSPSDFWQRWHISLSSWLRDYLYIPLGGNRARSARVYFNLMVTMLLGGLWHGARWTFVAWGAYQGLLLVIWRAAAPRLASVPILADAARTRAVHFLQWLVFFHLVCLGWLIFRAQSFTQLRDMIAALLRGVELAGSGELAWQLMLFGAPVVLMQVAQYFRGRLNVVLDLPAPVRGALYASWLVGIALLGQFKGNEFIYFQF